MSLTAVIFAPDENVSGNEELVVIYRGVALYGGKILASGAVWGADMLLEWEALRSRASAKALSYLETNKIGRSEVFHLAASFPRSLVRLRKYVGFLALRRSIILMAKMERSLRDEAGTGAHVRSHGLVAFFQDAVRLHGQALVGHQQNKQAKANFATLQRAMKNATEPLARFFSAAVEGPQSASAASTSARLRGARQMIFAEAVAKKKALDASTPSTPPQQPQGPHEALEQQPALCSGLAGTLLYEHGGRSSPIRAIVRDVGAPPSSQVQACTTVPAREQCSHRGSHMCSTGFECVSTPKQCATDQERGSYEAPPGRLRRGHSMAGTRNSLKELSAAMDALRTEVRAMDQHHRESIGKLLGHMQADGSWPTAPAATGAAPNGVTANATQCPCAMEA